LFKTLFEGARCYKGFYVSEIFGLISGIHVSYEHKYKTTREERKLVTMSLESRES